MDSNALIIILFLKYIKKTGDNSMAVKYYSQLKKAIQWYENHERDHLIHEGPYAGWADSVKKRGHVLYTNALYYKAVISMQEIAAQLDIHSDAQQFEATSKKII